MSEEKNDSDSPTTIQRSSGINIHIHFNYGDGEQMDYKQIGADIAEALEHYAGIGKSIKKKEKTIDIRAV